MKKDSVNQIKPTHVIGIGASAGGLEALQSLFSAMPSDLGVAYVIVQHLSPDFKSMMDELLGKNTLMPVEQAKEDQEVLANHVYLIPSGKLIRITEGRFYLSDLPPDNRINLPINEFFRSLADSMRQNAIGIVLSGTGSDGSRGIQALKENGGMVITQDPEEAQFDGMPVNAINTGAVDFVLSTKEMPERLKKFLNHPLRSNSDEKFRTHLSDNAEILEKILSFIIEKTQLDFKAYKESTVARRIEHRMGISNKSSLEDYYEYIKANPQEVELLKQDLLIGVTQFFRDPEVWETLRKKVIEPLILGVDKSEVIRVWSTGCSTGEEPYTLAMIFADAMKTLEVERQIKIFASDIDQSAVSYAANGLYSNTIEAEVPSAMLANYFVQLSDGSYQVTKELRSMVVFATHNLISDPPFSNMHLISCRNTLIYLQNPAQQKALAFFHFALKLGGHLLLGSAETPGSFSNYFEIIDSRLRIYKKNKDIRIPVTSLTQSTIKHKGYHPTAIPHFIERNSKSLTHEKEKMVGCDTLMEMFVPPTLIFNNKLQVIYNYGDTTLFTSKIKPGQVSNDISSILDPKLISNAITAAHQVVRQKQSILMQNVFVSKDVDGSEVHWSLKAYSFKEKNMADELVAISFIKEIDATQTPKADITYTQDEQAQKRLEELDESLIECQKLYREVVEELDSTSEELQSSNEELMAANEELQSTNEELQSVNEELYTVNSEYQQKILELTNVNNDLQNLIKTTRMAVVFLDKEFKIRRYTEAFRDFVNIIDFDIDRDFRDLSLPESFKGLHDKIAEVNQSGKEQIVMYDSKDGEKIMVTILPYLAGHSYKGVVISMGKKS